MDALFRLPGAVEHAPEVAAWFAQGDPLRRLVEPWFATLRSSGPDVREALHDGRPTVCLHDAAFGYVDAFTGHANVGFFYGAALPDPAGLLQGAGRRMRHVKLRWGEPPDGSALGELITAAYADMADRVRTMS